MSFKKCFVFVYNFTDFFLNTLFAPKVCDKKKPSMHTEKIVKRGREKKRGGNCSVDVDCYCYNNVTFVGHCLLRPCEDTQGHK